MAFYPDPSEPIPAPDAFLLVHLRQQLQPGHALAEVDDAPVTAPQPLPGAPAGGFAGEGAVTGETAARLDEVRGFNASAPYVAGEYGVTLVEAGHVSYALDGISYRTELATGRTTYSFGYAPPVLGRQPLAGRDAVMFHERRPLTDAISIDRPDQPVLLDFYAVARATTLEDLPGVG